MNKFFIICLILFGLSGCITSKEKNEVSNKLTNNQTKIDLSQNKFQLIGLPTPVRKEALRFTK